MNFKEYCINQIRYLMGKHNLDLIFAYWTETTSLCKLDMTLGMRTKIKDVLNLQDEFTNALGDKTSFTNKNGYFSLILPKQNQDKLMLMDLLNQPFFKNYKGPLKIALGKDVDNVLVVGNLQKMVHILVGGETGGGKSIFLHSVINSLIHTNTTHDLRLVLVDLKRVEFTLYENIRYLLKPVVYRLKEAEKTLEELVNEMHKRFKIFQDNKVRDITSYRNKIGDMNFIVVVIDELANLVLKSKIAENYIIELASLSRAAGIHLILATQKPTTDVIKPLIKANCPTRIAFAVASHHDSKVILDSVGAEKLNKRGDMLLKDEDGIDRIQGAYISEEEIEEIVSGLKEEVIEGNCIDVTCTNENDETICLLEYDDTTDDGYRMFYRAAKETIDNGFCNHWQIKKWLHVGDKNAAKIIKKLKDENIISRDKLGYNYEVLMIIDEFNQKFMEV